MILRAPRPRLGLWSLPWAVVLILVLSGIAAPRATAAQSRDRPALSTSLPGASITGSVGNLLSPVAGGLNPLDPITSGAGALAGVGLAALGSWVLGGARAALQATAGIISQATAPRLRSTWFSATYWRVAGLGALLTLPFLFAAAAQALLRSDLALLLRAALGYLPLALLGVSLAAPLAMLMLAATDQMCSVVADAGVGGGVSFLRQTALAMAGLGSLDGSPFLGFVVGLFILGAAIALAVEMLVRAAAVYVVLLMLPLAFAGLVWPARRIWAIRLIELLVALILSKFVIVAVLSLAGAAYGSSGVPTVTRLLTAMSLLLLSTFAPWVMLRLLPFTELAAGAAGALRAELPRLGNVPQAASQLAEGPAAWAESLPGRLRRHAERIDDVGADAAGPVGTVGRGYPVGGSGGAGASSGPSRPPRQAGSGAEPPSTGDPAYPTTGNGEPAAGSRQADLEFEDPARAKSGERLPGMPAIWQADDGEWPPMVLGPGGWSGPVDYQKRLEEDAGPGGLPEDPGPGGLPEDPGPGGWREDANRGER